MHPELTLITQNKNLALTFAETGFAISSVPILAQHNVLHAVTEGEVLLTADGIVPTIGVPIVIVDVRNVLHMVRLCELIRRILAVQPRTLQDHAATLQQKDAVTVSASNVTAMRRGA